MNQPLIKHKKMFDFKSYDDFLSFMDNASKRKDYHFVCTSNEGVFTDEEGKAYSASGEALYDKNKEGLKPMNGHVFEYDHKKWEYLGYFPMKVK